MKSEWDEYADGWDSNSDTNQYSEEAFVSLKNIVSLSDLNILDFGCGTGLLTEKMSKEARQIVALDTSSKMIDVLRKKKIANVKIIEEELSKSVMMDNNILHSKFDLITASSVCSFLPDYAATLVLLKSLLVPGGLFVQWDWLLTEENSDHGLSEDTITETFNKVGLEFVSSSQPFALESPNGKMIVLMGVAKNV